MAGDPTNLSLVYLRRLDAKVDQVMDTLNDRERRITAVEGGISNLPATQANHYANTMLRIDAMSDRITRVERRVNIRAQA